MTKVIMNTFRLDDLTLKSKEPYYLNQSNEKLYNEWILAQRSQYP